MADAEDGILSVEDLLDTGRMREHLELARRIQRAFLPKAPPGLHGYEVEGWNEPCYEAGGDYYDYLRLPVGRLALVIGDVSSHGIGPALLMASARSALRALLQVTSGPGDALERLNDVLAQDMVEDHFMTMFVGILNLSTKQLRYAIAGHERPLLLRRGSDVFVRLEAPGMPLGVREGLTYQEAEPVVLRPGDLVVGLTDGIWEATNEREEEFGYERLEAAVRRHRDSGASEIASRVKSELFAFIGNTRQVDDLTLMVLKVI